MKEDKAYKTPIEDLRKSALEHYEEASNAIHSWRSEIPRAINFYYDNHEYANQQPEVENQTEKILRIAEVARNDPDFERISKEIMEKVESYGIEGPTFSEYLRSIGNPLKSTLTQDKVRDDKTLFQKEYPLTYDILLKEVYKDETLRLDYAGGDICAISKKGVKQFTPKTELDYWVFDCGVIFRCYDMGKTERELEKALNQNK